MLAWLTVFGLGMMYFIAAIPTGVALGLSPWLAAGIAWAGYAAITLAALLAGTPVRQWVVRRFGLADKPDPEKWVGKIWLRGGLPGLALLAPVLCGPYVAALLALAFGEKPARLFLWISFGALPWCIAFAGLAWAGFSWLGE